MRRREFIAIAGGAAAWPLAARAQQSPIPVVGFLGIGSAESTTSEVNGFRHGLSESGYIEVATSRSNTGGRKGKTVAYRRSRPISFTIKWPSSP